MLGYLKATRAAWLLAALLFELLGCEARPETRAEDAVVAFFAAVDTNDCAEASRWLGGTAKQRFDDEECDSALEALRRKRFERVLGSQIDGRDPDLHLVRVRFSNERTPAVIGVRRTRQGPRIVTF